MKRNVTMYSKNTTTNSEAVLGGCVWKLQALLFTLWCAASVTALLVWIVLPERFNEIVSTHPFSLVYGEVWFVIGAFCFCGLGVLLITVMLLLWAATAIYAHFSKNPWS